MSERGPRVYTRTGDDGTTGLLFGGRVAKTAGPVVANGDIDEAQAAIGAARAEAEPGTEVHDLLTTLCRDLWRLMAEVATAPDDRHKLGPDGVVTAEMVTALEHHIDDLLSRFDLPAEFVVPGEARLPALLDVARTVVRRAERSAIDAMDGDSLVVPYLNRLSDLLWTIARWQEGSSLPARTDRA